MGAFLDPADFSHINSSDSARVVGEVHLGDNVVLMFGAVVRADSSSIRIGNNSNIQDNATVHCDPHSPVVIGENVSVGHNAVVHGCTVGDNCIIGLGSVILNGASIGQGSIVGAGAVVLENTVVPPRSLVVGSPGVVKRSGIEALEQRALLNAAAYQLLRQRYLHGDFPVHKL